MTIYIIFLCILFFSIITTEQIKFAQRKELDELDQLFEDATSE